MFEWCSIGVSTIVSPAPTLRRPHAYATRLIASVTFFVKIVSAFVEPMKLRDPLARALEALRRLLRERVDAAVDVGVVCAVGRIQLAQHRLRLLRGRAGVEVDDPLAGDLALQDRELRRDRCHVEGRAESGRGHAYADAAAAASTSSLIQP